MSTGRFATDAPLMGEPQPVELMNTIWADKLGVHDALGDRAAAAGWLDAVTRLTDLVPVQRVPSPDQLTRLTDLRDALRRLAAEATADPRAPADASRLQEAVDVVNAAAAATPSWPQLRWDEGPVRSYRSGGSWIDATTSSIATAAIDLFADAHAQLRACVAPGCVLYFVKSHPRREWCSASCGNRARVARHYRRHGPGRA